MKRKIEAGAVEYDRSETSESDVDGAVEAMDDDNKLSSSRMDGTVSDADDLPWASDDVLSSTKGASMRATSDAVSLVKRVHACSHMRSFAAGQQNMEALENLRKTGGFDKLGVADFRKASTKEMRARASGGYVAPAPAADVYRYNTAPPGMRGLALVVGNTYKGTSAALPGCDTDARNMEIALKGLGYQTELMLFVTKAKLRDALFRYSQMDHSSCDSFVFYYSGHGNNDPTGAGSVIVTEDLQYFPRADLVDFMTPGHAHRSLTGLPKLFFFDSCRGSKSANRWPLARDPDAKPKSRDVKAAATLQHTDILIAQATYFGEVSWGGETGIWTDGLIYYIKEALGVDYPVGWSTLLFKVNKRVADEVINGNSGEASGAEIHLRADVIVNAPPVPRVRPSPGSARLTVRKDETKRVKPVYVIHKKQAGYAVVIGNAAYKADGFQQLDACKKDADFMEKVLRAKGYQVLRNDDLKARDIQKLCHAVAQKEDHGDSFFWYFSGHGDLGKFFGIDGVAVNIDEVTTSYRPMSCEALRGRPKLYFWDCCQGANTAFVKGVQPTLPEDADFFYGWATVPHYVSYADGPAGCSRWTYYVAEQLADATEPLSVVLERAQGAMAEKFQFEQRGHTDSYLGYPVEFEN